MMHRPFAFSAALFKRFAACRSGSAAVEMGIVMPILTLAIVGTIYAGWLLFSVNVMYSAVESAARCVAVNAAACKGIPGGATQVQQTQKFAAAMAMGLNVTQSNFSVTQPGNGCGWQVSYNYTFAFPMPFSSDLSVIFPASACYPAQPS